MYHDHRLAFSGRFGASKLLFIAACMGCWKIMSSSYAHGWEAALYVQAKSYVFGIRAAKERRAVFDELRF